MKTTVEGIVADPYIKRMVWAAVCRVFPHGHAQHADSAMSYLYERLVRHGDFVDGGAAFNWLRKAVYSSVVEVAREEGRISNVESISLDQPFDRCRTETCEEFEFEILDVFDSQFAPDEYEAVDRRAAIDGLLTELSRSFDSPGAQAALAEWGAPEPDEETTELAKQQARIRIRRRVNERYAIGDML